MSTSLLKNIKKIKYKNNKNIDLPTTNGLCLQSVYFYLTGNLQTNDYNIFIDGNMHIFLFDCDIFLLVTKDLILIFQYENKTYENTP